RARPRRGRCDQAPPCERPPLWTLARRVAARGVDRRARSAAGGGPCQPPRAFWLHARGADRDRTSVRCTWTRADLVDGGRHSAAAARRACTAALQLFPPAVRA